MGRIISYQNGWRASKTFPRLFHVEDGEDISTTTKPETWEYLKAQENEHRSRTWKERHAKGLPVHVTPTEFANYHREENMPDGHWVSVNPATGDLYCSVRDTSNSPRLGWPAIAAFKNFRYKQSWLYKKRPVSDDDSFPSDFLSWPAKDKKGGAGGKD